MKQKSILIVGDSWGKGEMGGNYVIAHPGVNLYLAELGYDVIPKAYCGGTNRLSLKRIEEHPTVDYIVFFFTDPTRDYQDFINPYWAKNKEEIEFRFPALSPFPRHLSYRELWFERRKSILDALTIYNDKIILIGGNCRIEKFAKNMGFRHTIDWVDLIAPGNEFPEHWGEIRMISGHNEWIRRQTDQMWDEKEKYLETMAKYEAFWVSGWHPDRKGHKVISEWIDKTIKQINP